MLLMDYFNIQCTMGPVLFEDFDFSDFDRKEQVVIEHRSIQGNRLNCAMNSGTNYMWS